MRSEKFLSAPCKLTRVPLYRGWLRNLMVGDRSFSAFCSYMIEEIRENIKWNYSSETETQVGLSYTIWRCQGVIHPQREREQSRTVATCRKTRWSWSWYWSCWLLAKWEYLQFTEHKLTLLETKTENSSSSKHAILPGAARIEKAILVTEVVGCCDFSCRTSPLHQPLC